VHVRIAIVGAGFGGLGAAIRLKQRGFDDFVVLERAARLGGTWRDNVYPGCACDVQSHLYSFSFAPNPDWTRTFSPQPEIWAYLERCADTFGVRERIRFSTEVRGASWDQRERRWTIETDGEELTADVLISAAGPLNEPAIPKLAGLETFQGAAFHSARWPAGFDPAGRRVAVVGTGASAIQFVPEIQPRTGHLTLFQRTPAWVMPRNERAISDTERRLFRAVPFAQKLFRTGIYWSREGMVLGFLHPKVMRLAEKRVAGFLEKSVPDPDLRAKLTPKYTMGCKRVLQSNTYYPALTKPNVDVVTEPIREVRPQGIVTVDGTEHPADAIIFGTGFRVADVPIAERIRGRDGRSLAEVWQGSPKAYRGVTVAGFPNLFLLPGPSTGIGHTSVVFMMEAQLAYVLDALERMRAGRFAVAEPRAAAQERFVSTVDARLRGTVWASGCESWYRDGTGRISTIWPGYTWRYRQWMRRFDEKAYVLL
jgi:cation diffusion facilitator CzcD-associated flavoprotein CzcO